MHLLVLLLATWRLSSLLVNEDGLWSMFTRLRTLAGVRYNGVTLEVEAPTMLAGLFACMWCMSVWVGLFWWMMWRLWPDLALWGAVPLALSAGAILIDRVIGHA